MNDLTDNLPFGIERICHALQGSVYVRMVKRYGLFGRYNTIPDTPAAITLIKVIHYGLKKFLWCGAHGKFEPLIHCITELVSSQLNLYALHEQRVLKISVAVLLEISRDFKSVFYRHILAPCSDREFYIFRQGKFQRKAVFPHNATVAITFLAFVNIKRCVVEI